MKPQKDYIEIFVDFKINRKEVAGLVLISPFLVVPIICLVAMFIIGKVEFCKY